MKACITTRAATPALALIIWLFLPQTAQCFYNPSAGRWLNRDPIAERGEVSLYVFSRNGPIDKIDPLGQKCIDPCGQFKRPEGLAGAVICCEGDKYICAWGPFPTIMNPKATAVITNCILDHENFHADDVKECDKCRKDIYRPDWKRKHIQPSSECKAWTAEYNCLVSSIENTAVVNCGNDRDCRLDVMGWANNVYREFLKGSLGKGCPVPPPPPWWKK
jgi:hypothetical protein